MNSLPRPAETRVSLRALHAAQSAIERIVLGKQHQVRLALACLLARGHLLIEDMPGMGKTTLAHALAQTLGLSFKRVQFTADLLPADILGVSIYQPETRGFHFHPGPVFTQLLLADEINRATPKTQSALLEAMEEHQVSCDGATHPLPSPFFVIATQNPRHLMGTFPLPESQLDRFLMRLTLGYPERDAERALLSGAGGRDHLAELTAVLPPDTLAALQAEAERVHVSPALLDYIQALLTATRDAARFAHGLSPRAGLGWLRAARAWALLEDRPHVLPEDIQAVGAAVMSHRLDSAGDAGGRHGDQLALALLKEVAVP